MRDGPQRRRVGLAPTAPARLGPLLMLVAMLGVVGCSEPKPAPPTFWTLDATEDEFRRTPHRFSSFEIRPPSELRFLVPKSKP